MQSRIINLAIAMRNALFSLDELIEISKRTTSAKPASKADHNYMSMQQLGVSPGRTRPMSGFDTSQAADGLRLNICITATVISTRDQW